MELQVGKSYRLKNDIFNFEKGEVWLLADGVTKLTMANTILYSLMRRNLIDIWFYEILQMKI